MLKKAEEEVVLMRQARHGMDWSGVAEPGTHISVTAFDKPSLLADIKARFEGGQGFSIATLNLDHAVKLRRDATFRTAYMAHSHITADGKPIVWLSRLAGQRGVSLAPGSELVEPIAELAQITGIRVGLYGATDASLQTAAEAMVRKYPGLEVPMRRAPAMGFDPDGQEAGDAIEAIRDSGVRLVFVALGAPRQERFAARAQKELPDVGFVSIGAGLDFISGAQTRAPIWVRRIAAEWIWRMAQDPKRLGKRYMECIAAMPRLTLTAMAARRAGQAHV